MSTSAGKTIAASFISSASAKQKPEAIHQRHERADNLQVLRYARKLANIRMAASESSTSEVHAAVSVCSGCRPKIVVASSAAAEFRSSLRATAKASAVAARCARTVVAWNQCGFEPNSDLLSRNQSESSGR